MRRFLRSFRDIIHANTSEGTITTRLLPNLSFAALFFLLIYHSLLTGSNLSVGLPANLNFMDDFNGVTNLMGGGAPLPDTEIDQTRHLKPMNSGGMKALVETAAE